MASMMNAARICELVQQANDKINALMEAGVDMSDARIIALEKEIERLDNITPSDFTQVDGIEDGDDFILM